MAKKKSFMADQRGQAWLNEQSPDFWIRLQVYPDAISHHETGREYEHKAKRLLIKTGCANLRYICSVARIDSRSDYDSAEQLAERLLTSSSRQHVIYLATFLRIRNTAVVEYFEEFTAVTEKSKLIAEIASHSEGRFETLKPFTKLLYLYTTNPSLLENVHYRYVWRRLPTIYSYSSTEDLSHPSVESLTKNANALIASLNKLKSGEAYEWFGRSRLTASITVFVIHRCFPPSVRSDYQNKFRLQHDFSTVTFALDEYTGTILVKIANRAVAEVVRDWVSTTLSVTLLDTGSTLFTNYRADSVEGAFLGGYDESEGIDLIGITFRYSVGPNHSPISLKAAEYSRSIREDLSWLRQAGMVRLRSLSDIESFRIRYEDHEIEITGLVEKGGAVRFRVNDTGLTEELTQQMRMGFQRAFSVPLDQSIDPTLLAMGPSDIYHYLLGGVHEHQVQPYQRDALGRLVEYGLLKAVHGRSGLCTDVKCSSHRQPIMDEGLKECPACQSPIKWQEFVRYDEDRKVQIRIVRKALEKATGWKMDPTPYSFESHKFYRLSSSHYPGQTICCFLNDRINSGKMETFHRAMFPVLIVHPLGQQSLPVIDPSCIAHVGLPFMLAALDVEDDWKKFRSSCKDIVQRLVRMEKERILKASRLSHEHLQQKPTGYNDRNFEADIFNLLRSLFPFTVKWGGGNKPDGFCSLVFFPDNELSKSVKYNWSYDAKFSESTYDFGIGEHRQMFDYVRRLHTPKSLKSLGNRYNAHVIITNSMEESAMRNAASFMTTQHRLGSETPDFQLVFMRESFLVRLWELVRASEGEFEKRSTYLSESFVATVNNQMNHGYCLLDSTAAVELAAEVLEQPPVQDPVDPEQIKKNLRKQMKPTGVTRSRK